jgi:hypothetical protein
MCTRPDVHETEEGSVPGPVRVGPGRAERWWRLGGRGGGAGSIRTMTPTEPSSGSTSRYQFSLPGGVEIEVRELADDDAAAAYARELSNARQDAIVIKRHDHVDWEYVTEVDETP